LWERFHVDLSTGNALGGSCHMHDARTKERLHVTDKAG
jgi:hypothetical protein